MALLAALGIRGVVAGAGKVLEEEPPISRPRTLEYPSGVCEYARNTDERYADYLVTDRGFGRRHLRSLFTEWGLKVGRFGKYNSRIVIPYHVRGEPVYFTARAITTAEARYKAQPHDQAVVDPKSILFNQDALPNPAGVIVCEGPLDAIKATLYGPLPAVALSTNHATDAQLALLRTARRVYLMCDNDRYTEDTSFVSEQALLLYNECIRRSIPSKIVRMPRGFKDLADIPYQTFPTVVTLEYLCA